MKNSKEKDIYVKYKVYERIKYSSNKFQTPWKYITSFNTKKQAFNYTKLNKHLNIKKFKITEFNLLTDKEKEIYNTDNTVYYKIDPENDI